MKLREAASASVESFMKRDTQKGIRQGSFLRSPDGSVEAPRLWWDLVGVCHRGCRRCRHDR